MEERTRPAKIAINLHFYSNLKQVRNLCGARGKFSCEVMSSWQEDDEFMKKDMSFDICQLSKVLGAFQEFFCQIWWN